MLALQRAAGNVAVGAALGRTSRGRLARVTPVPIAAPAPGLPPPGVEPPPLPRIPGFGELRWMGSASETAETVAADIELTGATTVAEGEVIAAGTSLGEGVMVAAPEVAAAAAGAGGEVVVGELAAEGTLMLGATLVEEGAGIVGAATLLTPAGWIVVGVVVVGAVAAAAVVYLLLREEAEPIEAPGREGEPMQDPGSAPPLAAPAKGGMAPVREPGRPAPVTAPGAAGPGAIEAARRTPKAPTLEGRRGLKVYNPDGSEVTDIDDISGGTLWEEKSPVSAADLDGWVDLQITEKFEKYLRARTLPPLSPDYANAPIGFRFLNPVKLELAQKIWDKIEELRAQHPDVEIELEFAEGQSDQR